jgi:nucleotide-binding universal stress UspA family protein
MPFEKILAAADGSEASDRAFAKALELASLTSATLTALAVEGPLPAYAATIGEVEEVKREKDAFFGRLLAHTREQAESTGVEIEVELHPGHAAELIVRIAHENARRPDRPRPQRPLPARPPARLHCRPRRRARRLPRDDRQVA